MIEVKITGNAEAFFKHAPDAMNDAVNEATFLSAGTLLQGVRRASPVLTGALRESHNSVDPMAGRRFVVASDLEYSEIVQRRTNYLDAGLYFVKSEMERNILDTLEAAIGKAAG